MNVYLKYHSEKYNAYYCTWVNSSGKKRGGFLTLNDLKYEKEQKVNLIQSIATIH